VAHLACHIIEYTGPTCLMRVRAFGDDRTIFARLTYHPGFGWWHHAHTHMDIHHLSIFRLLCREDSEASEYTARRQNIQRDVKIYSETSEYTVRRQNIRCHVRIYSEMSEYAVRRQNMR